MLLNDLSSAPKQGGVYCIKNLLTGECYVGQSSNIHDRLSSHRKKSSTSSAISAVANSLGFENFSVEILLLSEDILERYACEREAIMNRDSIAKGYNKAEGGPGASGFKCNEEQITNRRNANIGRVASEDTLEKKRIASTGFRHSSDTKQKLSAIKLGVSLSENTKKKMSISRLGSLNHKSRSIILEVSGVSFKADTVSELSQQIGIPRATITGWLRLGLPSGLLTVVAGKVSRLSTKLPNAPRDLLAIRYVD